MKMDDLGVPLFQDTSAYPVRFLEANFQRITRGKAEDSPGSWAVARNIVFQQWVSAGGVTRHGVTERLVVLNYV